MRAIAAIFLTVVVVGIHTFERAAWAETMIGVIASFQGDVHFERGANATSAPMNAGDAIHVGDQIVTGEDGVIQILLLDETILTLSWNGRLTFEDAQHDYGECGSTLNVTVHLRGVIRYTAPSDQNAYPPFVIDAGNADWRYSEIVRDANDFTRYHLVSVCLAQPPVELVQFPSPRRCSRGEAGPHCIGRYPGLPQGQSELTFDDFLNGDVTLIKPEEDTEKSE